MSDKLFPVLVSGPPDRNKTYVPWSLLEPHRAQALKNHGQTLERLAERGGLSVCEIAAVVQDRAWFHMKANDAWEAIYAAIAAELERMCEELAKCVETLSGDHRPNMYVQADEALARWQKMKEESNGI